MRLAVDTGGTFTDLVVEGDDGTLHLFKSATTPDDPVQGVLDVLATAAGALGDDLLARGSVFLHATTRAINAVLTGTIARTAFLTTEGHPDVLLFREGGRTDPFNFTRPYPEPYVPRALTFEVPERVDAAGEVVKPLDEQAVVARSSMLSTSRPSASACSGRSRTPSTRRASATCSTSTCRAFRTRSRTDSIRRSASTGARRRRASTPR